MMAGVPLDAVTTDDLTAVVERLVLTGPTSPAVVANQNLHGLYFARKSPPYDQLTREAAIVHVDGMGVVLLARLLGLPIAREHRTTYADWVWDLMKVAERNSWRVFFLGGTESVNGLAIGRLTSTFPSVAIEGHHGYLTPSSEAFVLGKIAAFKPQLLFVCMGMPRQEEWVLRNKSNLEAGVVLMAGACVDFVAGTTSTPPRWMGRVGLEWLYRFAGDPRRLAVRYLIEPWSVLLSTFRERRKTEVTPVVRRI